MPAFDAYESLMAALDADVLAVWTDTKRIYHGWPPSVQKLPLPYAVIWMDPEDPLLQTQPGEDSVQGYMQRPNLMLTRVQTLPLDKSVGLMDQQVSEANTMIARIERNAYYQDTAGANLGMNPVAWLAALPRPDIEDEKVYEVTVGARMSFRRLHTSKQS